MSRLPDASNLPPARRTMADITALFMSGAAPGGSRPQRIPPRGASSAPLAPSPASPVTPHAGVPAGPVAQRMEVRPPVNGSKSSMPDLTIPAFTKEAGFKDVAFPASTPVPAKATIPPAPTAPMPPVQAAKPAKTRFRQPRNMGREVFIARPFSGACTFRVPAL